MTAKIARPPLLSALLAAAAVCAAAGPGDSWGAYRQDLTAAAQPGEYGIFALNGQVYAHAREDLADLRVVDGEGRFVPLAVLPAAGFQPARRHGSIFNQVFRGDMAEAAVDLGDEPFLHDGLDVEFAGASAYVLRVAVQGSDDGRGWGTLAEDLILARLPESGGAGATLARLRYPPCRYRYLRLLYRDLLGGGRLRLTGAVCETVPERLPAPVEWPVEMRSTMDPERKEQVLHVDLGCTVPVEEMNLRIETPRFFRQAVLEAGRDGETWEWVGEERLFRYRVVDTEVARTAIVLPRGGRARYLRLRIAMGDDEPLQIVGVEVRGRPDEVIFATGGASEGFRLAYGAMEAEPARHDLAALYDKLPAGTFGPWLLSGEEVRRDGLSRELGAWPPWLFWLGLIAATVVLAGGAALALRRMGAGNGGL